jgi:hypothetical protein
LGNRRYPRPMPSMGFRLGRRGCKVVKFIGIKADWGRRGCRSHSPIRSRIGRDRRYGRDCGVRRPEPVGSNAQCEQFNQADPDHQHGECHWIVVEPLPPAVHDTPPVPASLVGPAGKTVQCGAQIPGHETMRHGQPLGGHILGWLSAMTRPSAFAMKSDDEEIESGDHRKSAR